MPSVRGARLGHPDAGRQGDARGGIEQRRFGDAAAQPLGHQPGAVERRLGQQHDELLAADAGDDVGGAFALAADAGDVLLKLRALIKRKRRREKKG
jgi:hypothetical protein